MYVYTMTCFFSAKTFKKIEIVQKINNVRSIRLLCNIGKKYICKTLEHIIL